MIIRRTLPSLQRIAHLRPSSLALRSISISSPRNKEHHEVQAQSIPDQILGTREELERVKREVRDRYMDKLKKVMEEKKVSSVEELRRQVAPKIVDASSITPNTSSSSTTSEPSASKDIPSTEKEKVAEQVIQKAKTKAQEKKSQAKGDRAGIKPLSDILNLDLIFSPTLPRPHTTTEISLLWQSYHSLHPTLSDTFLSATIPSKNYRAMVEAATKCGRFVVPLPRALSGLGEEGYEMFFMQWLFHPTEGVSSLDSKADGDAHSPLPITSVLFTPLAEFRKNGEWSQPHLVLTHYPDLYNITPSSSTVTSSTSSSKSIPNGQHHPIILLRGEILSSPNSSALSSPLPSSNLSLTQSQAQLLAMALQRFYCSSIPAPVESEKDKEERLGRKEALEMFARGDERFDWEGLVQMAYGGVV